MIPVNIRADPARAGCPRPAPAARSRASARASASGVAGQAGDRRTPRSPEPERASAPSRSGRPGPSASSAPASRPPPSTSSDADARARAARASASASARRAHDVDARRLERRQPRGRRAGGDDHDGAASPAPCGPASSEAGTSPSAAKTTRRGGTRGCTGPAHGERGIVGPRGHAADGDRVEPGPEPLHEVARRLRRRSSASGRWRRRCGRRAWWRA